MLTLPAMIQLFSLGFLEIGVLVLAVLFLFGGNKMKGIAREIIQGYGKVRDVKSSVEQEFTNVLKSTIIEEDKSDENADIN